MKYREALSRVLASFVAVTVAAPASFAAPITSISVKAPIGGAPVGPAGVTFNSPGMNFSPMGASLNAPTLTGSVLPGLQSHSFSNPKTATPMGPTYLPKMVPNGKSHIPTLPPSINPVSKPALSGRVQRTVESETGSVAGVQDLKEADKSTDGLPQDMDNSLRTVRGQRNRLGLRFVELRKAFDMPVDDASFSPDSSAPGSLQGRDSGSVNTAGTVVKTAPARRSWTSRSYLARAAARLAGFGGRDASSSLRATEPTLLGVNFSFDRMGVSIFGGTPAASNAAQQDAAAGTVARDRVLRVSVPTPGASQKTSVALKSVARKSVTPFDSAASAIMHSPIVLQSAAFVHQASVRSFASDGPVRRWLSQAVARVNAYASSGYRTVRISIGSGSSRRSIIVPLPAMTAQATSGWAVWLSSLAVPFTAMYLFFTDQLRPRLALAPVPVSRPRA